MPATNITRDEWERIEHFLRQDRKKNTVIDIPWVEMIDIYRNLRTRTDKQLEVLYYLADQEV